MIRIRKTAKTALGSAGLIALLALSGHAAAGHRDSLGSVYRGDAAVIRYSLPDRGWHKPSYAYPSYGYRHDSDISVNIIVGSVPSSYWLSSWRSVGHDRKRHYGRRGSGGTYSDPPGYVFNSSLGYIREEVVETLSQPRYNRDYRDTGTAWACRAPTYDSGCVYIDHEPVREVGTTLLRDRHGQCWEKERDRQGRTIRRRVAPDNCDF